VGNGRWVDEVSGSIEVRDGDASREGFMDVLETLAGL
jgi:hypothetical protein